MTNDDGKLIIVDFDDENLTSHPHVCFLTIISLFHVTVDDEGHLLWTYFMRPFLEDKLTTRRKYSTNAYHELVELLGVALEICVVNGEYYSEQL